MTDHLMAFVAFALLAVFLGILAWFVPRLDLGIAIGVTLLLVFFDFFIWSGRRS